MFLLYLTTQICFPIGGEHVTCHGSKLTNSLGKQQLLTLTWSSRAPWNGSKFVWQSSWCQKAIEVLQRFILEKVFTQEKRFMIRQNKEENFNFFCLQAFHLEAKNGSPAFGNLHFDCCHHSPCKKIVPCQIKPRILELSTRRRQSNLGAVFCLC